MQAAGEERHGCSYPVLDSAYCDADLPGEMCPLVRWQHGCYEEAQQSPCFLTVFEACSTGGIPYLGKS